MQQQLSDAYWNSKHPDVRALREMSGAEREGRAVQLALAGHQIDTVIMSWGWSTPYEIMKRRAEFGYTWVPHMLQPNITIAPGLFVPGMTPYDPDNPPPGSIKVSVNLADYPAFDPPPKPAPPPGDKVCPVHFRVGISEDGDAIFVAQAWDDSPEGTRWSGTHPQAGVGTWTKHYKQGPVGTFEYWEQEKIA